MDSTSEDQQHDTQSTQQATQKFLDPRRIGKQNSGFSDTDIADIVCLLLPSAESTRAHLRELAYQPPPYMADAQDAALAAEGLSHLSHLNGENAIVIRLSARFKDTSRGFTFGRSPLRCDVAFNNPKTKRLSNVHFRIYFNEYGVLMLEDLSMNGLYVDASLLKQRDPKKATRRTINTGSVIRIIMETQEDDLEFLVRIPRREGDHEKLFRANLQRHLNEVKQLRAETEDAAKTIIPGPAGHVDLFPATEVATRPLGRGKRKPVLPEDTTQDGIVEPLKEWDGSEKYNRVCRIGKGAFATVYKVTAKFDGKPYAAKELDKRKFMKNGILDQKVENEMKIMQRAKHRNIVEYIEHIDYDDRLFIIIMEYVPLGDLGDLVTQNGPLMESAVQTMSSQLLSALAYLHRHNITHRDVKPDNILVHSMKPFVVKLTDFGLSKMADPNKTFLKTFCGTLLYCAPEVYNEFTQYDEYNHRFTRSKPRRKTLEPRYDHAVDMWSLGGVLYYTLTGRPPFPARNGISYTELLHQIMTKPLNLGPLVEWKISSDGIDCLKSMLQRRPQERATAEALQVHPWLKDTDFARERDGDSQGPQDGEIDDELGLLGKEASQLSLEDRSGAEDILAEENADAYEYDTEHGDNRDSEQVLDEQFVDENIHIADFDRFDSHHEENYTFDQMPLRPQRLFGEVFDDDSSADTPNRSFSQSAESALPATEMPYDHASVAALTFNRTQIYNPQPQQSSDQPAPRSQLSRTSNEAQDLEGTESQLGNLNMKSVAACNTNLNSFNTSKRKPSQEASEEVDSTPRARPLVKRIRSEGIHEAASSDEEAEQNLYSQIPALTRNISNRQIDKPVHKSTYWDAHDRRTWHLHYPEMTQLQHDVFASAAKKRGEEFLPGKTPLWDLAMKHFPPAVSSPQLQSAESGTSGSDLSSRGSGRKSDEFGRLKAAPCLHSVNDDLPETMSPGHSSLALAFTDAPFNRIVASLDSAEGSVLPGISISIDSALVSWGRERANTHTFPQSAETKVPKYGFKILLWKEGFRPSRNFRPWNLPEDEFYFYISTKATHGIFVNDMALASFEPDNPKGPSHNWVRLYDGDVVLPWRGNDRMMIKLKFNCNWGGSARPRPAGSPAALVPTELADRLDASCRKAEAGLTKLAEKDRRQEAADFDASERLRNIDRERLRSQVFEAKRLEACRIKTMRASRRSSPAHLFPPSSAPPNMMAFGNGAITRQQNSPTLQHAVSVVDTRALRTMVDE